MKFSVLDWGLGGDGVWEDGDYGIYVHVPFCRRRCPYCVFRVSLVENPDLEGYTKALLREDLQRNRSLFGNRCRTLYFGGGTPSTLGIKQLAQVIDGLISHDVQGSIECSLEVNPEDVSSDFARDLASIGVTRVSLGIQSFDDKALSFLGRKHDGRCARKSIDLLAQYGIEDISIDLIYGHLGADLKSWERDLIIAQESEAVHLSCYELGVEAGSQFFYEHRRNLGVYKHDDDIILEMLDMVNESGFERYEISNYSRKGYYSLHNLGCWASYPYLGLGVGAHSFWYDADKVCKRRCNGANVPQYIAGSQRCEFEESVGYGAHLAERLFLAFRSLLWVEVDKIVSGFVDAKKIYEVLDHLVLRGYLEQKGRRYRSTSLGLRFHDTMSAMIFESF